MKRRSFRSLLPGGVLLLGLAASALAVPKPARPNNQNELLQQHARVTAQQHLLQQAAAARQHELLAIHAQTAQQQLLKTHENFFKLHLLEQARIRDALSAREAWSWDDRDRYAPVTKIERN